MLIQFSVENCLSIKNKQILSMLASNDKEHSECLITDNKEHCLKSTVIYGANASGKSNVLNAFWFMVNYVLTSHNQQLHKLIGRIPFKFDRKMPDKPSCFEVIFTTNGIKYVYGFSVNDKEVVEEYLYYYPNGRKATIFERKNHKEYYFTTDVEEQNTLKERTSANKLYLSVASNWSYAKVIPVLEWFASCKVITKNSVSANYGIDVEQLKDDNYRAVITDMLKIADFGIQGLQVREKLPLIESNKLEQFTNIDAIHIVQYENGDNVPYSLNMGEESDGTKSYFKLIGIVREVLENGSLLVADEIDAHLHPLLTKYLVSLFNSCEYNKNGAQLIFTSHNTNLLDTDFLRRDQIWFTEKNMQTSATDLFSLYDFSVRKDAKIEKGYLLGRYGAIPFIQGGM